MTTTDYPICMPGDDKYKLRFTFDLDGDIDAQIERAFKILEAYRRQVQLEKTGDRAE